MASRRISPSESPSSQLRAEQNASPITVTEKRPAPTTSPFLPTSLEAILLLIYPVTLVAGSLFSTISPWIGNTKATYSATHQSYQPPHEAPSYFAQKRNIFNVYFVKVGWFWTTITLLLFTFTHPSFGRFLSPQLSAKRLRVALRWLAATLVWTGTTQWFFGPPLIDRSFRLTGGSCALVKAQHRGDIKMDTVTNIMTHAQCKVSGGTWSGGIDISGHVFLLILGSGILWMEILPTVLHSQGLREDRVIQHADGTTQHATPESHAVREKDKSQVTKVGVKFAIGVLGLMWWMLLMTAAFFHSWVEKVSGLVVAFLGLWLVYFLPRGVPAVRSLLGMPGI